VITLQIDEEIVTVTNKLQQETSATIAKETAEAAVFACIQAGALELDGQTIVFKEKSLFADTVRIRLPEDFTLMDRELAVLKYPSGRRPNLIYTDPSTTVNIAFNYTATSLMSKDIDTFKKTMMQTIRRMQPVRFLEEPVIIRNGRQMGCFEFISPALDGEIYNLTAFTPLNGRAILIGFNCYEEERPKWQPVARGIINTLQVTTGI